MIIVASFELGATRAVKLVFGEKARGDWFNTGCGPGEIQVGVVVSHGYAYNVYMDRRDMDQASFLDIAHRRQVSEDKENDPSLLRQQKGVVKTQWSARKRNRSVRSAKFIIK